MGTNGRGLFGWPRQRIWLLQGDFRASVQPLYGIYVNPAKGSTILHIDRSSHELCSHSTSKDRHRTPYESHIKVHIKDPIKNLCPVGLQEIFTVTGSKEPKLFIYSPLAHTSSLLCSCFWYSTIKKTGQNQKGTT